MIQKEFEKWVKDGREYKQFSQYTPMPGNVIVRLFVYVPPAKGKIILPGGSNASQEMGVRPYPFVKVMAVGPTLKDQYVTPEVGEIYTIDDDLTRLRENPTAVDIKARENEFPKPELPNVSTHIYPIINWSKYVFKADKFSDEFDRKDAFTFLIPVQMLKTKCEVEPNKQVVPVESN